MTDLNSIVSDLAHAREVLAEAKNDLDALVAEFQSSDPYKYFSARVAEWRNFAESLDSEARRAALDAYRETGNKKPHPALGVRVSKAIRYDPEIARKYCLDKLPGLMVLDAKRFEKVAMEYPLEFVEIGEAVQATIAQDLSEYLIAPETIVPVEKSNPAACGLPETPAATRQG